MIKMKEVIFGFVNYQGLQLGKRENMARECRSANVEFMGLAETRMVEENSEIEGYKFVGRGKVSGNEYDGVGLMYRIDKGWDVCEDVEGSARSKQKNLNGRIITYNISKGKDHIVLTIVYMKIEGGTDFRRINVSILEELSWIEAKNQNNCWLLMGDFNAHIGLLGEEVNVNGRLMREWIIDKGMILKNLEVPGKETG